MTTESQVMQTGVNQRRAPFRPTARNVASRSGEPLSESSIQGSVSQASVFPVNDDPLQAEYLLLLERIKTLESENANLQMQVQCLQELCLLE